jgi:MFS family permease
VSKDRASSSGGGSRDHGGDADSDGSRRRWLILFIGLIAMTAGCTFQYGLAYLIPALRHEGFSLELASILVACPTAGLLLTLIGWGAAADRWGERIVLATGLGLAGVILQIAASVHGAGGLAICLALGGAAGGSVFAASGRLILGWFARHERGLAMGIRQSAQPLGVALAALTLPTLGGSGTGLPFRFLGGFCLVSAALVVALVRDPARPTAPDRQAGSPALADGSPYRQPVLWRIHAASALLVVPQFAVATFALVFLVDARGWEATTAGRVGSRMRPMRMLAVSTGVGVLALAVAAASGSSVAVPILLVCAVVSVSTNGLAFTAVAEYAGPAWAGRALGIQNTGQNALAAATPPVLALAIGSIGFGASFAVAGAFPVVAAVLVPVGLERASPKVAASPGSRTRRDEGRTRIRRPRIPPATERPPSV